jgi:uncharacterized protein YbjT (DUF2867 family)
MKSILVIGGTGAQGGAVVRHLASTGHYHMVVLTRDTESSHSKDLISHGNIELVTNRVKFGYDLDAFEANAAKCEGVLINTDGFALGEQAETYWGMRLFEAAVKAGVKHIVYSGLDNAWRDSGYDPSLYVGHYQGKARVIGKLLRAHWRTSSRTDHDIDFIHAQPPSKSSWTVVTSGPYMEMLSDTLNPRLDDSGKYAFNLPLGAGAVPFIHLDDFARYIDWIFTHPQDSASKDIGVGTAHVTGDDIAKAFTAVTGKPAVYNDIPASMWTSIAFEKLPDGHNTKVGFAAGQSADALNQSFAQNFNNWWNLYKASAGNKGLIKKDYEALDNILPDRVRSVQEWMEKVNYTGEQKKVLKMATYRQ